MTPLISLKNVSYAYDTEAPELTAVKNVSIDIEAGSFTVLLGKNGSGKSTLAKLFNGLLIPTEGTVLVKGADTADESSAVAVKRTVGMVFQNPDNQLVATAVDEDVAFGLENLGAPREKMDGMIDAALSTVGMLKYKYAAPHELSGGQKQRVSIAGVLAMAPECIVLDEPTSMLDPAGRAEVIGTVSRLCREKGITVVLITHFMDEALLADRVIVIDGGRPILDGTPNEVFSKTDMLKAAELEAPAGKELLYMLEKEGISLSTEPLAESDCVDEIVRAIRREKI